MRIFQRGDTWYIDYTYQGKRCRKRSGHSKRVAELTLKDLELRIERRENLGIKETKNITFTAFAGEYMNYARTNKAKRSWATNRSCIRAMTPQFGDSLMSEITPQMIEHHKAVRSQSVTPTTVNHDLALLKNMFNKAIEWGYLAENPMKRVKLLKEPPGRLRYLTFDEAERLLKELPEAPAAVVAFALNTGMRKGEILGLKWRDINFDQKQIAVEKTKTNERRWVPINDQVYRILEAQKGPRKPSDPVFADGAVNLRKHFEGAVKRANLENFRFHDCRHSFASQLVMSGANIRVVQQLLGHKDIKMTMRYSHLSQDHLQEAVEKLGYRFGIGTNLAQDFSHPSEMGLSH
jgi:integrase